MLLREFYKISFELYLLLDISDKPGAPSTPKCKGTTEDSITLTWSPPKNDGGNPISGYVLEKKEKGDNKWQK